MKKSKVNKIFIISNSALSGNQFHKSVLKDADIVICADGGANNAEALGIVPDYVIGDMDSIKKTVLKKIKKNNKTTIITDKNQDKTDTELAFELALSLKPKEIIMLCALGTRIDHTMANILLLDRIPKKIKARIMDEKNEIVLVENNSVDVCGKKGDIVSVIPLSDVRGLTYSGLKWQVKNKSFRFNWFGICNQLLGKSGKVSVCDGRILIMKARD